MRELKADGYVLDLADNIPVPITYSIADVKDPSKRKRNFSKEVILPDTNRNRAFFSSVFSLTVMSDNISFDPTTKVECKYSVRGVTLLKDSLLKLNKVVRKDKELLFHIQIFAETVDVFQLLQQFSIRDLDWSAYDFTLSQANIVSTWSTASGSGIRCPLIDFKTDRPTGKWRTTDFAPYVHLIEILEKMHSELGITFTSSVLTSSPYNDILIGHGGSKIQALSAADIDQRYVLEDSGTFNYDKDVLPTPYMGWIDTGGTWNTWGQVAWEAMFPAYELDTSIVTLTEVQDDLSQCDSNEITIARKGRYKLACTIQVDYTFDFGSLTPDSIEWGMVQVYKNGVPHLLGQSPTVVVTTSTTGTLDYSFSRTFEAQAGDVVSVWIKSSLVRFTYDTTTPNNIVNLVSAHTNDVIFGMTCLNTEITDGSTIEVQRMIPDIKCGDVLLGAIRHLNLYTTDVESGGVTAEPLSDFYLPTSQFDDISLLVDYSKDFEIKPTANDYPKLIHFKFKEIKDHDATFYFDTWGERYGDRIIENPSYYAKGELVSEMPWGPIVPYEMGTNLLVPRFFTFDQNNNKKESAGPPRICFWNGLKSGAWTLTDDDLSNPSAKVTYPCIHHFDDWETPTFDLNFKLVEEVYYTATVVTTTNCYTEHHGEFINEMTSPAGQMVKPYVKLSETVVKNMDFRKLKMINGALFRLNIINDYDSSQASTQMELIKVLKAKKPRVTTITYGSPVAPNPTEMPIKFRPVTQIDDVYTVLETDQVIEVTAGTFNLTLPPGKDGMTYWIKNKGTGTVTIVPNGSETIEESISLILTKGSAPHIIYGEASSDWMIM